MNREKGHRVHTSQVSVLIACMFNSPLDVASRLGTVSLWLWIPSSNAHLRVGAQPVFVRWTNNFQCLLSDLQVHMLSECSHISWACNEREGCPPKSCFQKTAASPGGKSHRNTQYTRHSLISNEILFLPYRVNYIIKLELHTFYFFQEKSISRAKNSLLLHTNFVSCDIFQLQKPI